VQKKAGKTERLVIWRYKFDLIFEIILEASKDMSES